MNVVISFIVRLLMSVLLLIVDWFVRIVSRIIYSILVKGKKIVSVLFGNKGVVGLWMLFMWGIVCC